MGGSRAAKLVCNQLLRPGPQVQRMGEMPRQLADYSGARPVEGDPRGKGYCHGATVDEEN